MRIIPLLFLVAFVKPSLAADFYRCPVAGKMDHGAIKSEHYIKNWQFELLLIDADEKSTLKRCQRHNQDKICDEYLVEKIVRGTPSTNYLWGVFANLQIWDDGRFIENNGAGTIAWGTCQKN